MNAANNHAHHIVRPKTYFMVFGALIVFTLLTVAVSYVDLKAMSTVVALSIASCKALLVLMFFMHVKYTTRVVLLVVLATAAWLGVLLIGTSADYRTRPHDRGIGAQISQPIYMRQRNAVPRNLEVPVNPAANAHEH